jgi:eukaryotic-like serine/threonine-protein kinase
VTTRWDRIKDLFLRSQELPAAGRAAWLADACADDPSLRREVLALLAAQDHPSPILAGDGSSLLGALLEDDIAPEDFAGRRIGAWRVLRLLGEGGMGQVFLAEREGGDFAQRVALKRIRGDFAGAEARLRFLREREILARLAHPHVAQLHDGGVADDGTPYFTLEYVDGEPITRYCDARRLDVRARIGLLLQVCAAVAYAHRNLVVHRDIKPSNILVTQDGVVKLLDFGIAKLLEPGPATGLTATQAVLMTREYAAPEQVLGEPITTATDVYALGVLTYQLLTGHLPYPKAEAGQTSFAKAIVEHPPEPLSLALRRPAVADDASSSPDAIAQARASTPPVLRRLLRGDLQRIVQRALEKSPEARYPTIGAFAEDLRAVLDGRPIPGGTASYRMRKFARRHWLPLSAAAAALLVVLAGAAAIAFEARARAREAERALRETETTAAVKDFLLGLFAGADPRANAGKEVSVRDLLDKGALHVDQDLGAQPALQAELQSTLGGIYSRLGIYPQAIKLDEEAIRGLDAAGGKDALAATTVLELATAVRANGDGARAKSLLDESIARIQALPSPPARELIRALYLRAFVSIGAHRFDEALADSKRAEAIARAHPDQPVLLGEALHAKASAQWGLHDYKNAEVELKEAIDRHRAAGPQYAVAVGADQQTLALIYSETGRYADAFALNETVLSGARALMGDHHPYVAHVLCSTGDSLYRLGRYAEAEQRLRQALAVQKELLEPQSTYIAESEDDLGNVLVQEHRYDEAEQMYASAQDIWAARYGPAYSHVIDTQSDLALIDLARGRVAPAEQSLEEVLSARAGAGDNDVAIDRARLAEAERRRGELDAAIANARAAADNARKIHGAASWEGALTERYLALALAQSGRSDEAAANLRDAIAYYDGLAGTGDHPLAASTRLLLAQVLERRPDGRHDAIGLAERAAAQDARLFGDDDARTRAARSLLAALRAGRLPVDTAIEMIDL